MEAAKGMCRQMKEGIAAVFGPISKIPRAHVQSICQAFDIPYLSAQWDPERHGTTSLSTCTLTTTCREGPQPSLFAIGTGNISPSSTRMTTVRLLRLQEVLKATKGSDHRIRIRKLDPFQGSYISMFKDLKEKGEYYIVDDCSAAKALKVNMLSEYYHFHFTTLDLGGVDLEDYKYSGANLTAMRLIDPT
ncbi:GRIK1-like protein [Mya arenaria]|uniref:GRIK1-like protein n=1 Tax=Mya arenaria TaxID=6604 RepID=A0ABY7EJM5_MYAAR|nr:GRIK1-like protein [Mya arenaria]